MSFCTEYGIADVTVRLHTPREVQLADSFHPFVGSTGGETAEVWLRETDRLPQLTGPVLFSDVSFTVYREDGGYIRRYHDRREQDRPYAVGEAAWKSGRETVSFLSGDWQFFSGSQNCVSHIALEELLLWYDRLILHASFVASPFGGILFSGPSGIGKSTQADIWVRHGEARLINGDRTILRPASGRCLAYGSPYAGSSRCYVNEKHPVRAIVLLEQGSDCRLTRLPQPAAFQKLYAGTTVNAWNPVFVERVCTLLAQLVAEVPVYALRCTPDRAAVELLRSQLLKEETNGT